jgi:tRNA-uridine 2-sulfurtransferase
MKLNKNKVLLGMSGGVDSSTAAALLIEKGYDVTGITIESFVLSDFYDDNEKGKNNILDARIVCERLGIEHIVVDYFDYFKENVVKYFIEEYLEGRTPNPCVQCNPLIKWGKLIEKADELGAYYIATGHYADIGLEKSGVRYFLRKGKDAKKDQSYFLWKLNQQQLGRTVLPLGIYTKSEVRAKAKKLDLPIHDKAESQEVCFIGDDDYHRFLELSIPNELADIGEGDILFRDKKVGKHKGYPYYTIGQRKGLGVTFKSPLYVKKINPKENTIEVEMEQGLYKNELRAHSVNMVKYENVDQNCLYNVKTRYKDPGSPGKWITEDYDKVRIQFRESKRAITPGQSVVIYEGDDLVAGGIIEG